jgi:2,3-bisphosphoglycerate-dependent phosphoglycerate mutase
MKLIFARHGESTANTLHVFSNRDAVHPLTEKGRVQAQELAERLAGISFTQIFSSPVLRAVETTRIVCEQFGRDFIIAETLREFDVGEFEGRSDEQAWADFSQLWKDWYLNQKPERKIPGGESLTETRRRVEAFIRQLIKNSKTNDEILCVTHGGILCAVIPGLTNPPDYEFVWAHPLENTDLVILDWDGTRWKCLQWAETSFTDPK